MKWPLAVTLTGPNVQEAAGSIKAMRNSLGKFRRTRFWSGNVTGGVVSFEVTNTGKGWHVHCHLLVDCRWLALATRAPRTRDTTPTKRRLCAAAQQELSQAWAAVLGIPKAVVWVERAWGKALLETVKYCVKPADLLECEEHIGPLLDEMHRMQLVNGFGSCYRLGAEWRREDKASRPLAKCDECGAEGAAMPLDVVKFAIRRGAKFV